MFCLFVAAGSLLNDAWASPRDTKVTDQIAVNKRSLISQTPERLAAVALCLGGGFGVGLIRYRSGTRVSATPAPVTIALALSGPEPVPVNSHDCQPEHRKQFKAIG
jgi:hypothetical protein